MKAKPRYSLVPPIVSLLEQQKSHFESKTNFGKVSDKRKAKVQFGITHCFSLRAEKAISKAKLILEKYLTKWRSRYNLVPPNCFSLKAVKKPF